MTQDLGFPSSLIAVEKELSSLPHIDKRKIDPKRRADILCFAKEIHPSYALYPLLLVECKKEAEKEAVAQALGYNQIVQAYFLAVASKEGIETFWFDQTLNAYQSCPFLPSYKELIETVKDTCLMKKMPLP